MNPSRESISSALENKFKPMVDITSDVTPNGKVRELSRRLKTWDQAPKPSLYISELNETYEYQSENLQKRRLNYLLFFYFDAGTDASSIPITVLNSFLDAVDDILKPDDGNVEQGRCTLGGLVSHCYISGEVIKVSGDLDGEGMAAIPLQILVP